MNFSLFFFGLFLFLLVTAVPPLQGGVSAGVGPSGGQRRFGPVVTHGAFPQVLAEGFVDFFLRYSTHSPNGGKINFPMTSSQTIICCESIPSMTPFE